MNVTEGCVPSVISFCEAEMSSRVCVFVDGENFRHSIVDLFQNFHKEDYLPKSANWETLFDWLVAQVVPGGERTRTYWYVIETIDFWPYHLPAPDKDPDTLYRVLKPFQTELDQLPDAPSRQTRMADIVKTMEERREKMTRRFSGWTAMQNGIAQRHAAVEFRRAGAIRYDLFTESMGSEKAVDVKLAVDLIVLRDIYDTAIIVSGDQDYVPAVQVIKDSGKKAINVAFKTRSGRLLPGGARRLNMVTDRALEVTHGDLGGHLGL